MFKAVGHSHGVAADVANATQTVALEVVGELFVDTIDVVNGFVIDDSTLVFTVLTCEIGAVVFSLHWNHEGHYNSRHGGMDACIVEQEPHCDGWDEIVHHAFFAYAIHDVDDRQ